MYDVIFSFTDMILYNGVRQRTLKCSSYVGQNGGRQEVLLGRDCFSRGEQEALSKIRHEMLHAIGFLHEMNRSHSSIFHTYNLYSFLDRTETLT